jgi:hypothetical protein
MSLSLRVGVTNADVEGDECVLLDGRSGRYWQLNATGAAVVRAALTGTALRDIAAELARTRGVPVERAAADIAHLIGQLRDARLVTP